MLTDTKLRNLKPQDKLYKVNDRDGLYVAVTPAGAISFRYNYAIHGRQETVTFGRYGTGGITLSEARERLNEAKKLIAAGTSPAKEKARAKARLRGSETFAEWAEKWLRGYQMADSTRDMRRSVYDRDLRRSSAAGSWPRSPMRICAPISTPSWSAAHRQRRSMRVRSSLRSSVGPSSAARRLKTPPIRCAPPPSPNSSPGTAP